MHVSRREFLAFSAAAAASATLPGFARLALARPDTSKWFFKWDEVAAGVFATTPAGGQQVLGGNVMVFHGNEGAVLVDTKFAAIAKTLRREAESFGKPLRYVVNTHHHADHSGGNWAFTSEKMIKVVAHDNAKKRITDQIARYRDGIDGTAANVGKLDSDQKDAVLADAEEAKKASATFTAGSFEPRLTVQSWNLNFPGAPFEARHSGPGHTDNDLWIWLPQSNVLHTGDLCFNGLHPFIDGKAGATTRGWQRALSEMQTLCNEKTIVVPGHGPITDGAALKAQGDYFTKLRDHVATLRKDGKSREEVVKSKPSDVSGFDTLGFEQMFENALGVVFDELAKE